MKVYIVHELTISDNEGLSWSIEHFKTKEEAKEYALSHAKEIAKDMYEYEKEMGNVDEEDIEEGSDPLWWYIIYAYDTWRVASDNSEYRVEIEIVEQNIDL